MESSFENLSHTTNTENKHHELIYMITFYLFINQDVFILTSVSQTSTFQQIFEPFALNSNPFGDLKTNGLLF